MRSRRSGSCALGDFIIGLYIYKRARLEGVLQKQNTKILLHIKKITLSLYRYVCMHASYESSTAAHVSSNARAGAGRCSSNFLFTYVLFTLAFRNACIRKFFGNCSGDLLFVNFECSLFAFYWFLLSFCCFTSLQLHGLWNVVDRRTSNQEFLLSEVDPRETVKTSFWTLAFFQSWSELMVVVLLDHCQGEIRTISVWLLYLDVVFHTGLELSLAPHIGWVNWVFPPRGTVSLFPLF